MIDVRKEWEDAGGHFFGPHTEHAAMPTTLFVPFMTAKADEIEKLRRERNEARNALRDLRDGIQADLL